MLSPQEHALLQHLPRGLSIPPVRLALPPGFRGGAADPRHRAGNWTRTLDGRGEHALRTLTLWWPHAPPMHALRSVVAALIDTPVLRRDGDHIEVDATVLCDAAAALDPDAGWLARAGALTPSTLAALRSGARFPDDAWPDSLPTEKPLERAMLRTLAAHAQPHHRRELADHVRGHALATTGATLAVIQSDEACLRGIGDSSDPHLTADELADAVAAARSLGWADRLSARHPLARSWAAAPLSRDDALSALLGSISAPTHDDPLIPLSPDDGASLDWTYPASLAVIEDLEARLARRLPTRDWSAFDAPWEGELPNLWRDALIIAGRWDERWARRFADLDLDSLEAADPCSVLLGYPEQSDPRSGSRHSSYSHGLHDGTAESYGHVHSPRDPFSDR